MSEIPVMPWTCHILAPATGEPYCGADQVERRGASAAIIHGGLNSSNCHPCIAAAAKEPDAPPKCAICDLYHHDSAAWFFHGADEAPSENR